MLNEYLRLLARRESKEVLGKKSANLWLLTAVLAATFISIAFSNGSMIYLDEKMNDPFTNWVDIKNNKTGGTARLVRDLDDEALRERFLYDNVQQDHINSLIFQGRTGQDCYLEIRFFEHLQGKIVEAVMNPDNLVGGARVPSEGLNDETVGVILSESALTRLGFSEDSIPAYVDHKSYAVGPNVDPTFVPGFRDGFAPVALPVLGVVRRLPGNVDMIASTYLFKLRQDNSDGGYQLSVGQHPEYLRSLVYYLPDAVADADFTAAVAAAVPDTLAGAYRILDNPSAKLASWMPGRIKGVFFDERTVDVSAYHAAAEALAEHYADTDVKRLYDFARLKNNTLGQGNYISVVFNSLDSIRSFEAFAKSDAYRVQLEMAQVKLKGELQRRIRNGQHPLVGHDSVLDGVHHHVHRQHVAELLPESAPQPGHLQGLRYKLRRAHQGVCPHHPGHHRGSHSHSPRRGMVGAGVPAAHGCAQRRYFQLPLALERQDRGVGAGDDCRNRSHRGGSDAQTPPPHPRRPYLRP